MNGQYFFTPWGRQLHKQWGYANHSHKREMMKLYTTEKGRRQVEREKALKAEQEEREQEELRAKYAHIPHVPPTP